MRRPSIWLIGIAGLLAFLNLVLWVLRPSTPSALRVTFLDVGQGDCAVIRTPAHETIVIDTGRSTPSSDEGRRTAAPFLRSLGVRRIDALILTHPDDDHCGGARTLMASFAVARLVLPSPPRSKPPGIDARWREEVAAARARRVPVVSAARGQTLQFGGAVRMQILGPPLRWDPLTPHADNNGSLVARLTYGATAFLFCGDAERHAEDDLIASGCDLRADVLKISHHGSPSASTPAFIDAVRPRAAVISVGSRNLYGHPHPAVLQDLAAKRVRVFRTDRDGAVDCRSDGRTIELRATVAPRQVGVHRGPQE